MAKEGEQYLTKGLQAQMLTEIEVCLRFTQKKQYRLFIVQETIISLLTEHISILEARNRSLLEERWALEADIASFELLFPQLMQALQKTP